MIKPIHNLLILNVFFLGSLTITSLSFAEIYKWTDPQGKTHFSDKPPEQQTQSEEISSTLSPINRDDSSGETSKLQQVFKGPTAEEKNLEKENNNKEKQRLKKYCNKIEQRLSLIKGPVYFTDDNGDEVVVTEAERQQRVARLEQEIRKSCP